MSIVWMLFDRNVRREEKKNDELKIDDRVKSINAKKIITNTQIETRKMSVVFVAQLDPITKALKRIWISEIQMKHDQNTWNAT